MAQSGFPSNTLVTQLQECNQKKTLKTIKALPDSPAPIRSIILAAYEGKGGDIKTLYSDIVNCRDDFILEITESPFLLLTTIFNIVISRENLGVLEHLLQLSQPNVRDLLANNELKAIEMWQSSNVEVWTLMLDNGYLSHDKGIGLTNALSYILQPSLSIRNREEIIKLLLDHGAKPEYPHLKAAVRMEDIDLLNLLWKYFPQDELKNSRILHEAIAFRKYEATQWLLDVAKVDVNVIPSGGWRLRLEEFNEPAQKDMNGTALHCAVMFNEVAILKLLLRKGANPKIKNEAGKTPYQVAKERGTWSMVAILMFK